MGAGFQALAAAGAQNAQNEAAIRQQEKQQQRAQTAALYWNAVQTELPPSTVKDAQGNQVKNPAYDEALQKRENNLAQYLSYLGPEQHATIGNRLHALIFGPEHQEMQQNATPPVSSQAPVAPGSVPAQTPASAPTHPFEHNPVYAGILKGLDGLGSHLKAAAHPLPKQPGLDYKTLAEAVPIPEEQQKAQAAEKRQELKNQGAIDVAKERGKNPAGRPVPFGRGSVSVKDAQELAGNGQEFHDQDGNAIDISKLPESAKLTPWAWGNKIFYTIGDQVPRIVKADNLVTAQPEEGELTPASQVAPEAQLGVQRVPTVGTHQVPGMNPGEKINLTSTTTPVTPTRLTPAQANRDAISGKLNGKRSQSRQVPAADSPAGTPPPAFAKGTMLTQGRNAEPVVASMNTVAAQVFGGNGEPPLWSNAWMFDRPELRTALNKALTLNALAIPGTEDDPSFTQTLATSLGVTGWTQEQIQAANIKAREDLQALGGDQATEMFARMAGMQEDLSALRSATKGSTAQSSIRTLVRAAPIYNVASSKNFRDQLGVTLNTAAAAMSGYPAINPKYIDWWKQGARAARGNPVSSQAPKVGGGKHQPGEKKTFPNGRIGVWDGTGWVEQ